MIIPLSTSLGWPFQSEINKYYPIIKQGVSYRQIKQAERMGEFFLIEEKNSILYILHNRFGYDAVFEAIIKEFAKFYPTVRLERVWFWENHQKTMAENVTCITLPFQIQERTDQWWMLDQMVVDSHATSLVEGYLKQRKNVDLEHLLAEEIQNRINFAKQNFIKLPQRINLCTLDGSSFALKKYQQIMETKRKIRSIVYDVIYGREKRRILYYLISLSRLKYELSYNVSGFTALYRGIVQKSGAWTTSPDLDWDHYTIHSIMILIKEAVFDYMTDLYIWYVLEEVSLDNFILNALTETNQLLKDKK